LSLLISLSEEAANRRSAKRQQVDTAAALDLLLAPPRSAALGSARRARNVTVQEIDPCTVTETVTVTVRGSGGPEIAAERAEQFRRPEKLAARFRTPCPKDECLRENTHWKRLQAKHLRPAIDVAALQPAFYAALEAGLFDGSTDAELREAKHRFLAAA
jgi:hypothetical protein